MTTRTLIKPYHADWRDASQYPEYGSQDYERIAWEFIRRSDKYADLMTIFSGLADGEYQNGIKEDSDTILDGLECVPKAKAGETAREYYERTKKRKKRGRILPPKWRLKSRWYMEPAELLLPSYEYDPYKTNFVPHVVAMRAPKGESVTTFSLPLWPDEIAFRLRLDVSFEKQLRDVRDRFNSARADAGYKEYAKNVQLKDAHFWLRAFDAYHALVKATAKNQKEPGTWTSKVRERLPQYFDPLLKKQITVTDHKVAEWRATADTYISKGKFATLLYKREKTTGDATKIVQKMVKSSQVAASPKGRTAMR
ncbi:hypothetical protein SAMN06265795_102192 [Noviherbaspirillum humi]|uniref:Transcriptional regulator-like domain-containing protein n=1 Tax=Noviherbaspirillum humi TaxID=1688639 RepID=A0A239DHR7_9BURK|nr:hypothetical protein [Noviherbaspirillum humi]SNS31907.1 hypothetical protein SAMN06265795_102192 [Noviherbaspirillum humi]